MVGIVDVRGGVVTVAADHEGASNDAGQLRFIEEPVVLRALRGVTQIGADLQTVIVLWQGHLPT